MLTALLLVIALAGAYRAGSEYVKRPTPGRAEHDRTSPRTESSVPTGAGAAGGGHHVVTLVLVVVLAGIAILQWIFPSVLSACRRDALRIAAGQWWRLATALFVQDGGATGTIFNLVSLLLVGRVAERIWGGRRWLLIFFSGGVLSEVVATSWRPVGAGNSVATVSLAGAVLVVCLLRRPTSGAVLPAASLSLAAGAALLFMRDIHGAATLFGTLAGLTLVGLDRRPQHICDGTTHA